MTREIIIEAQNMGVSYQSGYRADDYKSYVFDFLLRRKKVDNRKSNTVWPLRDINITGYKGEILGIIGSNGSGKTTLCKVISGILQPDEGSVRVNGNVSALFSLGLGFNKELTGRENVYLRGMMLGIPKVKLQSYIDEIQEFAGLGPFMDRPFKYYSSGMRARLGFTVSAMIEPEILVLDEALNTGDMEFSERAAVKMRELVQKAKMVILVTHSLSYAEKHCDRIIWLEKGSIRAVGEPSEIIEQYQATIPERKPKPKKILELTETTSQATDRVVVEAKNVGICFQYKKEQFWALKDINFKINEGEVVGIIGHNGAGKSTLCRVLTKILVPDQGSINLKGRTSALLGIGGGFNSQLTGRDNIFLNGMLLGIPKPRIIKRYSKIVEFAELEKVIDKPLKQYSSGMRSRLGFSIAATLTPDIFIIDEALSAGDAAFNKKASEKIQEMIEKAKAVIVVTHSMSFVEKVCTRAIWLKKGRIQFDGDPAEAVRRYREDVRLNKKRA